MQKETRSSAPAAGALLLPRVELRVEAGFGLCVSWATRSLAVCEGAAVTQRCGGVVPNRWKAERSLALFQASASRRKDAGAAGEDAAAR